MAKTERYVQMKRLESIVGVGGGGGVGLLTTIDDLPYTYKIQYVRPESPLDLSKKAGDGPITPPQSPPQPPPKKRPRAEPMINDENETELPLKQPKIKRETTPKKPINVISPPKTTKSVPAPPKEKDKDAKKQHKAVRKLKFDEKKSSPVSGTIIRALDEIDENVQLESGDIDPQYNIVEVTEEAKAEIAAIPNVIGAYACKLCEIEFEDAFCLARHRCSCIVLLEYRCPECGKRFNCPANLASHRRWHKPKDEVMKKSGASAGDASGTADAALPFPCEICGKHFKRQAYLRKHLATHNKTKDDGASTLSSAATDASNATSASKNSMRHSSVCSTDDSASVSSSSSSSSACSAASQDDSRSRHSSVKFNIADYTVPLKEAEENAYVPTHLQQANGAAFHFFKREIFTEEENIAVAALAHLRHSQDSVIRHTTALSI